MHPSVKILALLLLVLASFATPQPAAAKGALDVVFDDQVIFGMTFVLDSGETLEGDLVVFGGSATIEEGATVEGTIIVAGGTLVIDGEVEGDVAVAGGSVTLGETAHIYGSLSTVGTSVVRAEGARVDGAINSDTGWMVDGQEVAIPDVPEVPDLPYVNVPRPSIPNLSVNFNPMADVWNAIVWAAVAMLVMLFLAPHAQRVGLAVVRQPLMSGGVGLLGALAGVVVFVALGLLSILVVTLIVTIPLMIVVGVALAMAAAFGWIALGLELGQRLARAARQEWHPSFSAGLGTFLLMIASAVLTAVPVLNCIGGLAVFLVGLAAFGAVIITRFGTHPISPLADTTVIATASPPEGGLPPTA
ncbi:MAG: polymer-forming cytoskeletal protein [Anaerolineales bacterium]|nr:polymer-forming cytoskeletal protein [Anaerolineales bacterium]